MPFPHNLNTNVSTKSCWKRPKTDSKPLPKGTSMEARDVSDLQVERVPPVASSEYNRMSDGDSGPMIHRHGRSDHDHELEMQPLRITNGDTAVSPNDKEEDVVDQLVYPVKLDSIRPRGWRSSLDDWLYPPHLPRSCQLLRPENLAVPACYLLVGLLQGLSSPLINVLPLDLGASEAQQTTLSSIRSLPASFKILFGFMSDNLPVAGYRRKPYMFLGWLVSSLSICMLLLFSNLNINPRNAGCFGPSQDDDGGDFANSSNNADVEIEQPDDVPSIAFLSVCLLGFGTGFWLADVMGDSIVAEKAKLEPEHSRGTVQSTCYACRFFGQMIAAPVSTYLYSIGPIYVIMLLATLPMAILPLVYILFEVRYAKVNSTIDQCHEIWKTVCSRAVWQPMGFVFFYNVFQLSNAAWREFLVTVLDFTSCQLNMILICAYFLLYAGIMTYKYGFMNVSWRLVYVVTTVLNGFFSMLQVFLITGMTFGLSPFLFALGDDAFAEFITGVQFLPTTIMMVHLCPAGSEGASYALFTTVNNAALTLSSSLSTMLLGIWDVSRKTLAAGDLDGMINLTLLTTALQVGVVAFVPLLPRFKSDLMALKEGGHSALGGTIFLCITGLSISYAIFIGLMNIAKPGWMGES